MVDLGGRLDFPLKSGDRGRILHGMGRKRLDSDDSLHAPVFCLEHLAHSPLADLFQQNVVAKNERPGFSPLYGFDLKPGQLLVPYQFIGQLLSVFGKSFGGDEVFQGLPGNKPALF